MRRSPEEASFEDLVRSEWDQLARTGKRYALYRSLPPDAGADIVATALERVWKKEWSTLCLMDSSRQLATIYRYMQYVAQEHERHTKRVSPVAPEELPQPVHHDRDPTERLAAEDLLTDVAAAMGELSDRERTVLELAAIAGLTNAEIAEQTGMSRTHVSTVLARARNRLKDKLRDRAQHRCDGARLPRQTDTGQADREGGA